MTLDEAIKHCYEKSKDCSKCANEHKQLFEWLKELKYLRGKIKMKIEEHKENVYQRLQNFHAYCYDYTENCGYLDNELDAVKTVLDAMFGYINALEEKLNEKEKL